MKKIEEVINYLEREIKKHDETMEHLYAQVVLTDDEKAIAINKGWILA